MTAPFVFFDIRTPDVPAAREFYASLFGWPVADVPMGTGTFPMLTGPEGPWAGFTELAPDDDRAPQWLPYAPVPDLDAALEKALGLGATLVRPRTELPVGTLAVITDPGGAALVLFQPAPPS